MGQIKISSIIDIPRNVSIGEKDTFGIEPFENGLTQFIEHSDTPITIALQGEWGSGKTSLMNSLQNNLSESPDSEFYSIWLNTWEYALMKDTSNTLIDIISKLIDEVSKIANVDNEKKKQLLNGIKKIGFSALKVASSVNNITSAAVGEIEKSLNQEKSITISQIRDELEGIIESSLKKDNKKGFIFFIDDLDRIDPPAAVQLLELLKNIFTLKNSVFVLAIDYDVVVKGLEPKFGTLNDKNEREFRSFFDKIIQVPFSMPVSTYETNKFLKESLFATNYIDEATSNNDELIAQFAEIANLSVGKNPRALKRLMNSLSLINFINPTKNQNEENDHLDKELEILVNFTLVSIQIAYPRVYKLLSLNPGFDNWNENVALQMNLEPLDQQSIEKLNQMEEFNEPWEKILFRLCENDHFLKKRVLLISRLLNSLKTIIKKSGEDIENVIASVISLSSITNLEAFDKPVEEYHRGSFLKHLRYLLIPKIQEKLPEIKHLIQPQGKRVQTNAYIKFTEEDNRVFIRLHSHPYQGKIRLIANFNRYIVRITKPTILESLQEIGLDEEWKIIQENYKNFKIKYAESEPSDLEEYIAHREGCYDITIYSYFLLESVEDFYKPENLEKISALLADFSIIINQINDLTTKVYNSYN